MIPEPIFPALWVALGPIILIALLCVIVALIRDVWGGTYTEDKDLR